MIGWRPAVARTLACAAIMIHGAGTGSAATSWSPASPASAPAGQAGLTIEHLLAIAHPSTPVWAPVGDRIAFLRELDGSVDLWWTSTEREEPVAVTRAGDREPPAAVSGFAWGADGDTLIYALRGDLYRYDVVAGRHESLTSGPERDTTPVLNDGGDRIAFLRDGDVWVGTYPQFEGGIVADEAEPFRDLAWSPDGRFLAAPFSDSETVVEDTGDLMGGKVRFTRADRTGAGMAVIDAQGGGVRRLSEGSGYPGEADFSPAGVLAWQVISADAKGRDILVAEAPDWTERLVVRETDEAWWTLTYLSAGPRWSPTDERFVFISERDGWAHAYLLDPGVSDPAPRPLTAGDFEVEEPDWSPDGTRLLLSANRGSSSERGLQLLDVDDIGGGLPEWEPISRLRGTSTFGRWSPDGTVIAFLHADPENPLDLWVQEPGPAEATQLSDTWPEELDETEMVRPQRVRFASSDGELIPAQLFLPPDHEDLDGPLPAVVWAHGGGIRQNRYGWHPLRAYAIFYGFHQYLLERGYVVVAVDYRGSIGYGRSFRQGHYGDLGGADLDDMLGAVRYLRRIDEVEVGRIGIWGISYGGFLTLQALVQAPTAFDAGIDIAGVADWADWSVDPGGLWIDGRMGPVDANVDAFRHSSPIHFADRLSRPLLILHGTADRNVPVLQSFELTDALVRAGKPFDVTIYPGEDHTFVRARTWRDAFRRIERFFDQHLRH